MKRTNSGLSTSNQSQCENTYYNHYKQLMDNQQNSKDQQRYKSIEKRSSDIITMSNSHTSSQILQQQNPNVKTSQILQPKYSFSNLSTCNLPLSQQNTARNRSETNRNLQAGRESQVISDYSNEPKQYFLNNQSMKQSNLQYQQQQQSQSNNSFIQTNNNNSNNNNTNNDQRGSFQSISSTSESSNNNYLKKLEQFKQEQLQRQNSNTNINNGQQQQVQIVQYNNLKNKSIKDRSQERIMNKQQSFGVSNQFNDQNQQLHHKGYKRNEENHLGLDNQILIKNYTFDEIENVIKELNCKCGYKTDIREVLIRFGDKFQDLRKKRDKLKEKNKKLKDELNEQFKDRKLLEMQVNYEGFINQVNQKLEEKEKQLQRIQTEIKLKETELKLRQDEVQTVKMEKSRQSNHNSSYNTLMPQQHCNNCDNLVKKSQQELDEYISKLEDFKAILHEQNDKIQQLEEELSITNKKQIETLDKYKDYDQLLSEKVENKHLKEQVTKLTHTLDDERARFERERSSLTMKIQEVEAKKAIVQSDERLLNDRERGLQEKEESFLEQIQQINYQRLQLEREKEKFEVEKNNFYNEAQKLEEDMKKKEDNIQLKYYVTNQNNGLQNTSSKKTNQSQYLNNPNLLASPSINNNNFNQTTNLNQNNHHLNSAQSNNISMNSMKFLFNCSGMEVDDEEMELKMIALKMNEEMISKKIEMQVQEMIKQKEKLDKREKELRRLEDRLNGPMGNQNHNNSTNSALNSSGFHRSSKKKL